MTWVYDIGMHNGDDSAYYLAKGYSVVGIEANPFLCRSAEERFAAEIAAGRMTVLNVAVAATEGEVDFYIDRAGSVKSSLIPPAAMTGHDKVRVRAAPLASLIPPGADIAFMKIDIEGADGLALASLRDADILPPLISVEAHQFTVIDQLRDLGYAKFRLVNGRLVREQNRKRKIRHLDGSKIRYRFRRHSSGPFGRDLRTRWFSFEEIADLYSRRHELLGVGWYDVHAALENEIAADLLGEGKRLRRAMERRDARERLRQEERRRERGQERRDARRRARRQQRRHGRRQARRLRADQASPS